MNRPGGRPAGKTAPVSRDDMLAGALSLLDSAGVDGFTMRALAERLQINPMTIYHHFGDRDGLIEAMSEGVYGGVSVPAAGAPLERLAALVRAYHDEVLNHPGLTLLIFSRPAVFPKQAQRITEGIVQLLVAAGLGDQKSRLWVNILVDFTHGAAIATAMGGRANAEGPGSTDDFDKALKELLNGLTRGL